MKCQVFRYCTNKIERHNLTLRTHLKRLNRRTICHRCHSFPNGGYYVFEFLTRSGRRRLDVSHLVNGIYFLKINAALRVKNCLLNKTLLFDFLLHFLTFFFYAPDNQLHKYFCPDSVPIFTRGYPFNANNTLKINVLQRFVAETRVELVTSGL